MGRRATVPYSLDRRSTPSLPVSLNSHPSFTSPKDQFCTLVVTSTLLEPNAPDSVPSAVALCYVPSATAGDTPPPVGGWGRTEGYAGCTDGGLNAIVRLDAETDAISGFPLPTDRPNANRNTAAFDGRGRIWFTGQNGIYGVFDPTTDEMQVFDAPRGAGPYGIAATPDGDIYFASLAGSYIAKVDLDSGAATVLEPPTAGQGARRVWSDSSGRIWVSEWNAGRLALYDPATGDWQEWALPGSEPKAYAVYVDDRDLVWLSDFGGNTLVLFDPDTEAFTTFELPSTPSEVRQLLGRPGELWAPESAADQLVVVRY